jgi:dGTP triphosphohydrolase
MSSRKLTPEQIDDLLFYTSSSGEKIPLSSILQLRKDIVILTNGKSIPLHDDTVFPKIMAKLIAYEEAKFKGLAPKIDAKIKEINKQELEEYTNTLVESMGDMTQKTMELIKDVASEASDSIKISSAESFKQLSTFKAKMEEIMDNLATITKTAVATSDRISKLENSISLLISRQKSFEIATDKTNNLNTQLVSIIATLKECMDV